MDDDILAKDSVKIGRANDPNGGVEGGVVRSVNRDDDADVTIASHADAAQVQVVLPASRH